jgi:SpoVK/Ycf46/Vps4 family AAA+-type ATPase
MAGTFKLKKSTDLNIPNDTLQLIESDFSIMTPDGKFLQFEYDYSKQDEEVLLKVKPGIFAISTENMKMILKKTSFTKQRILEENLSTIEITNKINIFFNKIDVYKKYGLDPKRAMLLYGAAGTGKTLVISKVCEEYTKDNDTLVVLWPSDKYEARDVKAFFKTFEYETNKVTRLILVIEDLGGVENADGPRRYSESSLLSLLDNAESTFKIPTMILATTNHPEKFLENLTDRPQRFDDVIEVKPPSGEFRAKFLEFFSQGEASEASREMIKQTKYDSMSVAHVKEIVIRSAIYDISIEEAILQIAAQSARAKKGFTKAKASMGMGGE